MSFLFHFKGNVSNFLNISEEDLDNCIQKVARSLSTTEDNVLSYIIPEMILQMEDCKSKWNSLGIIGVGMEKVVFEVKDNQHDLTKVMSIVSAKEAEFQKIASDAGLAPTIYDIVSCKNEDKRGLVMEKMDGDLSSFYPFDKNREFVKRAISIAHTLLFQYKIYHKDTKIGNYFWKRERGEIKIVLGDYGIAEKVKEANNKQFISLISLFINSIIKPFDYGSAVYFKGERIDYSLKLPESFPYKDQLEKYMEDILLEIKTYCMETYHLSIEEIESMPYMYILKS